MFEPLKMKIITLERVLFDGEVDSVVVPAVNGYMGVLPGHAPLMAALGNGVLKIKQDSEVRYFAVFGGFMQIKDQRLIVLADMAVAATEIDISQAREELSRAEAALTAGPVESRSRESLTRDLDTARVKVKAASIATFGRLG